MNWKSWQRICAPPAMRQRSPGLKPELTLPMLSDVVRGLIGVLRGDDGAMYFQMLSHDFKQMELQHLKKEAQKIPPKIRVFSFLMLVCFIVTYLAIIVFEILKSMGKYVLEKKKMEARGHEQCGE